MNIFMLDQNTKAAAQAHLDKHCVKMVIEYAQLLSTAKRLLDGRPLVITHNNKSKQMYLLEGESLIVVNNKIEYQHQDGSNCCYKHTHFNHPSAVWARQSQANYVWLYELFLETAAEYEHRYKRTHLTWEKLKDVLKEPPKNIPKGWLTEMPQAMDDAYKVQGDSVQAYRNYYIGAKAGFARWTNRPTPSWFSFSQA